MHAHGSGIEAVMSTDVAMGPVGATLTPTYSHVPQYGFAFSKVSAIQTTVPGPAKVMCSASETICACYGPHNRIQ